MSNTTAIAVIEKDDLGNYGVEQDSALAQMLLGDMAGPIEIADAYFVDDDTADDYKGIVADVPRLRLNAKDGKFFSSKDEEGAPGFKSLIGVMLCRDSNSVFFGFKRNQKERVALCKDHNFNLLLDVEGGYICRGLTGGKAELNPQLTAEQVAEAQRLRFGGATGQGCSHCPMSRWIKTSDGNKRLCSDSENVVWLDSQLGEPFVLSMIAGNTIQRLRKWISAAFQYRGRKMNLFAFAVKFEFDGSKDENDNHLLKMSILGQLSNAQAQLMREVREAYRPMLERAALANAITGTAEDTRADAAGSGPSASPGPVEIEEAANVLGDMV